MTTETDRARDATPADPLRSALRSLPREAAGEGFTEAVLDRLDRGPAARADLDAGPLAGRSSGLGAWRLAAAAALAVLVLAALVWNLAPAPGPTPTRASGPAREARLDAQEAERAQLIAHQAEHARLIAYQAEHARLIAYQAEHARLAAELEALRRLAEQPVPVFYLGGDDEVELVLDLGTLARGQDPGRPLPADYRPR